LGHVSQKELLVMVASWFTQAMCSGERSI